MNTLRSILTKLKRTENKVIPSPKKSKSNLHHSIASLLILAQCFAIMPLTGIKNCDISQTKFKWISFQNVYAVLNICGNFVLLIMNFKRYIDAGMFFGDMVTVIYFSAIFLTLILFFRIAKKWHVFMQKWNAVELVMQKYEYQPNLSKRFKITMCTVMLLALGEHTLFISKTGALLSQCSAFRSNPLRTYFGVAFAQIFAMTSFAFWKAYILEFLNILATFAWNFMDLFVMLMCAAMAEKFRQINIRVANTKIHDDIFWKNIREDYNKLATLCRDLDRTINHLISLCLVNDLFFITVQLFNTLKPLSGVVSTIYFFCSFGFLLARTAAVSIYAAWINDESKVILAALFNVPTEHFGTEADRLIQQITSCPVAITGSNYFEITRDLCLKVAGAIITFEVILQQVGPMLLNTEKEGKDKPFCLELEQN